MLRATIALIFGLLAFSSSTLAAKRVALVVGNSAYTHTGALPNPRNDAADVAAAFRKSGLEVIEATDLDKASFDRKVRDFAYALTGAEAAVFFYAGHGLQVGNKNYLVPIDAALSTETALEFEMVQLDTVHRIMERTTNTNIIFLDACRDNPLARNLSRAMGTRSAAIGRGLAAVESGVGTLISFSTQPGNVALDGTGRNSPFASALVKHLANSNDDLSALLISVRNDVMSETQRKQVPWEHSALTGRFYFSQQPQSLSPPLAAAPSSQPQTSEAERAWALTKDTGNISVLESYAARFKDTFYADLARARIDELKKQQVAIAPSISPPPINQPPLAPTASNQSVQKSERSFRLTSSFPKGMSEIYEPAEQIAKQVEAASSSKFKFQVFAAGEIVPGLQVLDAVQDGRVDLGWTYASYYFAKDPAFSAAGGAVPLGLNATSFVRWMQGEGKTVRAEFYGTYGVRAIPCSITGPKALMLRRPLKSVEDLRGLKIRVGGHTAIALSALGVVPQQLAAVDIYPNLEKGQIDGLEWLTPAMDEKLGFYKVARFYYYPFGEPTFSAVSDLIVNKRVWETLELSGQRLFEDACSKQLLGDLAKLSDGVAPALKRMAAGGAVVGSVPDDIATKYQKTVADILDKAISSPTGLALWRSLKGVR